MKEVGNKSKTGQIVETYVEDYHAEVKLGFEKTLEEETSEEDTEEILGTATGLTGIDVCPERENFQENLVEMAEVTVGQDQALGRLQMENGSGVSDVENMIILLRIVQA